MPIDSGSVIQGAQWLATTYLGDGEVQVDTQSASNERWKCEKDEQIAQVCPFTDTSRRIGVFLTRTYAFLQRVGWVSQRFEVWVEAQTNGCDVVGAYVFVRGYHESTVGRTANWRVRATAAETRRRGTSGCDDCCPWSAAVKFVVSVTTPGFSRTYRVRVFGNGSITVHRVG